MSGDKIIAIGLLTQKDLGRLGATFDRLWPVTEAPAFEDLLRAIDDADRASRGHVEPCNGRS